MSRHFLSLASLIVLSFCLHPCGALHSQEMLKVNILQYYDQVPPPPATAKEAYARCRLAADSNGVELGSSYKNIEDTEKELEHKIQSLLMQLQQPMTDKVKNMDQNEIQKKMKGMSQDEKIKYAMELSKQMGLGQKPLTSESRKVNDAMAEEAALNGRVGEEIQGLGAQIQAQAQRDAKVTRKHEEIEKWENDEEQKLPQISYGEMSAPEPKAYRDLRLRAADKHIAVANEALKNASDDFRGVLTTGMKNYQPYEEKLAAVNFGEDAKNTESKRVLVNGQSFMLQTLGKLIGISKAATTEAARWSFERWKAERLPVK
ncbi:MAG: hypothetical protein WB699_02860 [Bacteroidota bacterium]